MMPARSPAGGVLVLMVLASCGSQTEGPPPRYAEAPPTAPSVEHARPPSTEPVPTRPASEVDGGSESNTESRSEAPSHAPSGAQSSGTSVDDRAPVPQPPDAPQIQVVLSATGPLTQAQWNAMLVLGRRKFNGICAGCHGTGIGPRLAGRRKTAAVVRRQVRQGAGEMRPIPTRRLADDELEAVIVYLSTIRGVRDVQPPGASP